MIFVVSFVNAHTFLLLNNLTFVIIFLIELLSLLIDNFYLTYSAHVTLLLLLLSPLSLPICYKLPRFCTLCVFVFFTHHFVIGPWAVELACK
jgi:hypothetical protein